MLVAVFEVALQLDRMPARALSFTPMPIRIGPAAYAVFTVIAASARLTAQSPPPLAVADRVALANVRVVDVTTGVVRTGRTVVTERGRVVAVRSTAATKLPPGTRVVDGGGAYVIPGLWDSHVHLSYVGKCALPVLVALGVTSVRDAGARMNEITQWRAEVALGALLGPRIWTAGPNIESGAWLDAAYRLADPTDSIWYWGQRMRMDSMTTAAIVVDSLARLGVDFVKFRNLSRAGFLALAAETARRGLRLAGHAPKGISLADAAKAGLGSVEHAETVTLALGSAPTEERRRQLAVVARARTFVTPTLVSARTLWLTPDSVARAILADSAGVRDAGRRYTSQRALGVWAHALDLNKRGGDPGVDWSALYRRQVADMQIAHRAGVRLLAGTDLGSLTGLYAGAGLHEELELLVRDVGLTAFDALRTATSLPAAFMGRGRDLGVVSPGSMADFVLLDGNPLADISSVRRVRAVMIGGRLLERAELDQVLAGVAADVANGTGCARENPRER